MDLNLLYYILHKSFYNPLLDDFMVNGNLINFDELNKNYEVSVWDNCALNARLKKDNHGCINDRSSFARILLRNLPFYKGIFVPEKVMGEYSCKKNICGERDESERCLTKMFKEMDRVLSVNDFPLGPKVEKRDEFLKDILEDYSIDIQETDIRLISWAMELSNFYCAPVAIISNDMKGIARFYSKLVGTKMIQPKSIGFFPRRDWDLYGL